MAPKPSLLVPSSPRGARGPASAPGSAGHRGGGLWPLCTCSGPCGVAQGRRGRSAVLGSTWLNQAGWHHPSAVPSGSPHLPSLAQGPFTPRLPPTTPTSLPCLLGSVAHVLGFLFAWVTVASPDPSQRPHPPVQVPHAGSPASSNGSTTDGGPHRYTSARMLSMVATSGWQWPELRSRSSKAWRHSGTATS